MLQHNIQPNTSYSNLFVWERADSYQTMNENSHGTNLQDTKKYILTVELNYGEKLTTHYVTGEKFYCVFSIRDEAWVSRPSYYFPRRQITEWNETFIFPHLPSREEILKIDIYKKDFQERKELINTIEFNIKNVPINQTIYGPLNLYNLLRGALYLKLTLEQEKEDMEREL